MRTLMSVETLCPTEPLVPVIRIVKVPGEAVEFAVTVNWEAAWFPVVGTSGEGMEATTPEGMAPTHVAKIATDELNPLTGNTVIVSIPLSPCGTAM